VPCAAKKAHKPPAHSTVSYCLCTGPAGIPGKDRQNPATGSTGTQNIPLCVAKLAFNPATKCAHNGGCARSY